MQKNKQISIKCGGSSTLPRAMLKSFELNSLKDDKTSKLPQLMNSIVNDGFTWPIGVWKDHRFVADGKRRVLALTKLEEEGYLIPDIPVTEHEADDIKHARKLALQASSSYATITEDSFKSYMIDSGLELEDVPYISLDSPGLNIDDIELDVAEEVGKGRTKQEEDENYFDDSIETDIQVGNLFQLGNHRLLCGDSFESKNIKLLMNNAKADMVLTDPPYGMGLDCDFSDMGRSGVIQAETKNYKKVLNDDKPFDPSIIFKEFGYCKEIFLWGADYYADRLPDLALGKSSWLVWDKRAGLEDENKHIDFDLSSFELCWSKQKHRRDIIRVRWFGAMGMEQETQEFNDSRPPKRCHPNQKPTKLYKWFFDQAFSKDKNLIVDLFAGSGSCLIAAEQNNKSCYAIEFFPHYCQIIINRWEKITGKKAVKLN